MTTWSRVLGNACGRGLILGALGVLGCGETSQQGSSSGRAGGGGWNTGGGDVGGGADGMGGSSGGVSGSSGGGGPPPDILSDIPCAPYRPSDAAWSSQRSSRPAIIGMVSASPSGLYLYAAGTWLEGGQVQERALRSRDHGETWCVLSTPEPVVTIAASRADERVLYALTPNQVGAPSALLRSADGGVTWTAGASPVPEGFFDAEYDASDLETSLSDPNIVWLQRYVTNPDYGSEFYLSHDAGATWSSLRPPALLPRLAPPPERILREVLGAAVEPNSAEKIVTWGRVGAIGSLAPLLWFSSLDGGNTWSELHLPDTDNLLPMGATVDAASVLYVSTGSKLLTSEDWSTTWQERGAMPNLAWLSSVTPPSPGHLFAKSYSNALWRTLDRGTTWSKLIDGADESVKPILSDRDGSLLVSVADRWLSVTPDGGKTWQRRSIVPTPTAVMVSPVEPHRLWAQDDADLLGSLDGGSTWMFLAVDAWPGPNRLLLDGTDANAALRLNTQAGGRLLSSSRSDDGGRSWTPLSLPDDTYPSGATTCPGSISCALLLDRSNESWQCELKKTTDHGRTWRGRAMPDVLCNSASALAEDLLAVSPADLEHLLVACGFGDVCETRDGGSNWTQHPLPGGGDFVTSMAFLEEQTVLLVKGTFNGSSTFVLRSADGGTNWDTVHESPDAIRVITSTARPATAFLLHGINAFGPSLVSNLSRSDDGGATWHAVSLATKPVDLKVTSVVDAPGGGFLAATRYGLVRLD